MLSADAVFSDIFTLNTVGVMTQELKSLFLVQKSNQSVCSSYRPNAKMAAKLIFFCLCVNQSNWPRSEGSFLLYFVRANEASQAN